MSCHIYYFELTVASTEIPSWLSFTKRNPFSHQFHLQSFYCAFLQGPDYGSIKLKSLMLSHSQNKFNHVAFSFLYFPAFVSLYFLLSIFCYGENVKLVRRK